MKISREVQHRAVEGRNTSCLGEINILKYKDIFFDEINLLPPH